MPKDCKPIKNTATSMSPGSCIPRPGMTEIKDMMDMSIIEPSTSEWASTIVLVEKKDGTMQFCVDYRRLNANSETDG